MRWKGGADLRGEHGKLRLFINCAVCALSHSQLVTGGTEALGILPAIISLSLVRHPPGKRTCSVTITGMASVSDTSSYKMTPSTDTPPRIQADLRRK